MGETNTPEFHWSEFRFETLFTVPHIMIQRTLWIFSETPECPFTDGPWIIGRPDHQNGPQEPKELISCRAKNNPELGTWLDFLRSI